MSTPVFLRSPATGAAPLEDGNELSSLLPLFQKRLCVTLSDGRRVVGKLAVRQRLHVCACLALT